MAAYTRNDKFLFGLITSLAGHTILLALMLFRFSEARPLVKPVVYSVTLEGGKNLGDRTVITKEMKPSPVKQAVQDSAKEDTKAPEPPKEEKKEVAKAVKPEEAEISLAEKKKEEPKKKEEAKPPPKAKEPPKEATKIDINKKKEVKKAEKKKPKDELQDIMNKYLASGEGGGDRGGAAELGGNSIGGANVRPPEFFAYLDQLRREVKAQWRWFNQASALKADFAFNIAPNGEISNVELVNSSGNPEFDDSAYRAILKANPVTPPPKIVYHFFREVVFTFDPRD